MLPEILERQVLLFGLAGARIAGFTAVSPWPGQLVGWEQRVGFFGVLTLFSMLFLVSPSLSLELEAGLGILPPMVAELAVGLMIGIAFRMALAAAEIMGDVVSQSIGLGMPSVLNRDAGVQDTILSQVASMFAMLLALGAGVHRLLLEFLLESFRGLPIGGATNLSAGLPIMMQVTVDAFTIGVRLAAPVIAMSVALQVALGFIARAAPSLQLFSIGFTVLLGVGLLVLIMSLRDMGFAILEYFQAVPNTLDRTLLRISEG